MALAAPATADGDFGRKDNSITLDEVMTTVANWLRPGTYNLDRSDEEVDMANRLWRFVAPEPRWNWFPKRPETLRPGRRLWLGDASTKDRYFLWLHNASYQSSSVRYATVADDIGADLDTLPGAFASVCAVQQMERRRATAERHVASLDASVKDAVTTRRADNGAEIRAFVWALHYRYDSYGYALAHLLIETPDPAARQVDTQINALRPWVDRADRGRFCEGGGRGRYPGEGPAEFEIPSRFAHGNPGPADTTGPVPGS